MGAKAAVSGSAAPLVGILEGSMKVLERYSQAVNSSCLTVDERTTMSDTDVLGAAGLAARYEPLGIALTRMFADGNPQECIVILSELAFKRARTLRVRLSLMQAGDLSRAVLSWHRHGRCQPCGGLGFKVIPGTPALSEEACPHCAGMGKVPFDRQFWHGICGDCGGQGLTVGRWLTHYCQACDCTGIRPITEERAEEQLTMARWLSGEIERSQAAAGGATMAFVAPTLDL